METYQPVTLQTGELLSKVEELRRANYRLVQILATVLPAAENEARTFELLYTFGKDYEPTTLKVTVSEKDEVPSISKVYLASYLYENEIHEHFGINITGIAVDFKGTLYQTAVKHPFAIPTLKRSGA